MIHNTKKKHGDHLYLKNETISLEDRLIDEKDNFEEEVEDYVHDATSFYFYARYGTEFIFDLIKGIITHDPEAFQNAVLVFGDDL
jgi:hypothetical protein